MAYETNPWLAQQGAGIQQQANQNLFQNVLPGINSGAGLAGMYGGSRHGIAQGLGIGQSQTGMANALANLYGGAYENDQNRGVQTRGQDLTYNLGMTNAANQRYGTDRNYDLGVMGNTTNLRGQDLTHEVGMANANNNRYGIDINAASNRYNTDVNAGTAMRGQDLTYGLGSMQNDTAQRGQSLNFGLGAMQNDTTQRGQDMNYGLGSMQNQTAQRGQDLTYGLGTQQNDTTRMLGLGQIDTSRRAQDMNFYSDQRGQDRADVTLGANLYGAGMQGPWSSLSSANGLANPYTTNGTTVQNTNSGGGWQGAAGGALGTYQLGKSMGWWGA